MRPAFSVIFFSVLSGAGYGLLGCAALALLIAQASSPAQSQSLAVIIGVAMLLVLAGLGSSVLHLGRPARAWRAFSQWRSSWLSREGVSATLSFFPAIALAALLWTNHSGPATQAAAFASLLLAAVTIYCTGRIYTSLPPIPAWRGALVVPVYFLFAATTGLAIWLAMSVVLLDAAPPLLAVGLLAVLTLATALAKWRYWREIDSIAMPTPGRMTGLDGIGDTRSFEAPHTEANYLTREMGFQFARRHARALRATVFAALIAVAAIALLALVLPSPRASDAAWMLAGLAAFLAVALSLLAALIERWLFFAQAKHMVMAYYER